MNVVMRRYGKLAKPFRAHTPSAADVMWIDYGAQLPSEWGLEAVFHVPVIEAYSVTECAQIACNPLPPGQRQLGSVAIAAGPDVAIMDEADSLLPQPKPGRSSSIRGISRLATRLRPGSPAAYQSS
jgi:hypothetical protein